MVNSANSTTVSVLSNREMLGISKVTGSVTRWNGCCKMTSASSGGTDVGLCPPVEGIFAFKVSRVFITIYKINKIPGSCLVLEYNSNKRTNPSCFSLNYQLSLCFVYICLIAAVADIP